MQTAAAASATRPATRAGEPVRDPRRSRRLLPPATGHREAELLFGRRRRELADEAAFVDDEDAIGEREDLLELERDEEHRAAGVALLDQTAVHELNGADVETARRLRRDQHLRVAVDL